MILTTRLTGITTTDDVRRWKESLERDAANVPDGGTFKLLLDLRGYEPADVDAHKAMRVVIPLFLAGYGFRTALLDLFPGTELRLQNLRGITCTAFANVHHDATKMQSYEESLARGNERYFTDVEAARVWLERV
ncbi:MAG TPA: STAS/SEC14 domain-containing protein [Thermoanaerobaculia bacterium]